MQRIDYVLIGSGIMSTTLGVLLHRLNPGASIHIYEAADRLSPEASDAWNNAGTGHAGICELSYTPYRNEEGAVDVGKAISIFDEFEKSRQLWGSAVKEGILGEPRSFSTPVPHVSFVQGAEQVDFLRSRFEGLQRHHFFESMEYSDDREVIASWAPLLIEGRDSSEPVAATRMTSGLDVSFGSIARQFAFWLGRREGCDVATGTKVIGLEEIRDGWELVLLDQSSGVRRRIEAGFVFVGAGGATLSLLQKAGLEEARGYGGFPVGGQWLVCEKPDLVARHDAKVYGQPQGEAPTMAVPHLDARVIDKRRVLLFGPFASWTTRFLKATGRWTDLPRSIRAGNFLPMLRVALKDLSLVRYLIKEGLQSMEDRIASLRDFYPRANASDWTLVDAGIRVQAISRKDGESGIVHFGTEVITNEKKTIAALLGASPGASVSADVMLGVIRECFGDPAECDSLVEMIPALRSDLINDPVAYATQREETDQQLGLV